MSCDSCKKIEGEICMMGNDWCAIHGCYNRSMPKLFEDDRGYSVDEISEMIKQESYLTPIALKPKKPNTGFKIGSYKSKRK